MRLLPRCDSVNDDFKGMYADRETAETGGERSSSPEPPSLPMIERVCYGLHTRLLRDSSLALVERHFA